MKNKYIYLFIIILLLAFWEYFGSTNATVRLLLSYPSIIFKYFYFNYGSLLLATKTTFIEAISGLIIATIFSFGMMIVCFLNPKFMNFILPIMITSQVIPLIVLAPFFIMIMGLGIGSKIMMATILSFFPIFVNFAQGYKSINHNIHELMFIYNAKFFFRVVKVYFPLSMPSILAGLKVSATLSVIGAIVAEFSGAEIGLGKNLFISALRLEPDLMMSSLILSTLIGFGLFYIINLLEKKIIKC